MFGKASWMNFPLFQNWYARSNSASVMSTSKLCSSWCFGHGMLLVTSNSNTSLLFVCPHSHRWEVLPEGVLHVFEWEPTGLDQYTLVYPTVFPNGMVPRAKHFELH